MGAGLCAALFCSGAAALLFEALWFRLAGLALGNGIQASSLVLAAFMAGLALGNGLAARLGDRVARPLVLFARLEAAAAVLSLLLVLALPALVARLTPALASLVDRELLVGAARGAVAFVLMLLPAAVMGSTLPLVARALAAGGDRFGVALGRLYGWNTLGGVLGALASETLLVPRVGVAATAGVAVALQLAAALTAMALDRRHAVALATDRHSWRREAEPAGSAPRRLGLLGAAFLAGALLLGLEVVWFRFLQLFIFGTQLAFALMLAVVLAGIASGGILAAAWLARRAEATLALPFVALLGGIATISTYAAFDPAGQAHGGAAWTLWLAAALMLPTAVVSGSLFTLVGAAVREELPGDAAAAGWLTLANTVGAAVGAPIAGLVLLPRLGIESSLFVLALLYALVALALRPWGAGLPRLTQAVALGVFALVAMLFPFGLMQGRFLRGHVHSLSRGEARVVAVREGQTATAILLQVDWGGAPVYQQLVTNAHSMTSSVFYARRYMKLLAYWALALHPRAKRALVVSYGLGNTAEALILAPGLEQIDVVDPSRTILGLSPLVERVGAPDPLRDPRVRVHVDDGRFFLHKQSEPFDLITAEPPPPHAAGVASLYSLEYFELTRRRLAPGGFATHWLPVNQLTLDGARSVVRAFCAAFPDCSLWSGAGYDWMLAGSNGAGPAPSGDLARLWTQRATGLDLRELGVEAPEQLAALFIADAGQLEEWTRGALPLVDDRPGRLGAERPGASDTAAFRALQDPAACAGRFRSSAWAARLLPESLRDRSLAWFAWQGVFNRDYEAPGRPQALEELWAVLAGTHLTTLPLLQLDSEPRIRATARTRHLQGGVHPALAFHLGAAALADRDYDAAARFFAAAREEGHPFHSPRLLRAVALGLGGHPSEARAAVSAIPPVSLPAHALPWRLWLEWRLGAGASAAPGS
jgi:predicted membrane-bound spermidine synthase